MLGAIFQCYNEPYATYKTIESFRRLYPDGHIVAINDGAPAELKPAFEAIAAHFDVDYTYEDRRSFSAEVGDGQEHARIHMDKKEQIELYARRFAWSVSRLTEPHFVILEDDVLMLRKASPECWRYDINGCNPKVSFGRSAIAYLRQVRGCFDNATSLPNPVYYGACGGCVLNTEFFKKACLKIEDAMHDFCNVVPTSQWAGDTFISFLCYSAGGMIGLNPEFCETWYKGWFDRVVLGKVAILHKIKIHYGAPFTTQLLEHCQKNKYSDEERAAGGAAALEEVYNLIVRS